MGSVNDRDDTDISFVLCLHMLQRDSVHPPSFLQDADDRVILQGLRIEPFLVNLDVAFEVIRRNLLSPSL